MSAITKAHDAALSTTAAPTPKQVLTRIVEQNKGAIGASLPTGMSVDRFARLLLTAANTNPDLLACEPRSFLAAGVTAAQLGLEPNDPRGLAYLIPFNDKRRGKVVQFIVGYRGMLDLARRSGVVSDVHVESVFDDCRFEMRLGLDPDVTHVPGDTWMGDRDPKRITHVYAVAKIGEGRQFVVLTRRQIDKARASSRGADSPYSPWSTHWEEMAHKTALRRLCKMLPQTVEMARAVETDDTPLHLGDLGHVVADDAITVDTAEELEPVTVEEVVA
jgi:recombination protein RecT